MLALEFEMMEQINMYTVLTDIMVVLLLKQIQMVKQTWLRGLNTLLQRL
jgi:hypothetical protein